MDAARQGYYRGVRRIAGPDATCSTSSATAMEERGLGRRDPASASSSTIRPERSRSRRSIDESRGAPDQRRRVARAPRRGSWPGSPPRSAASSARPTSPRCSTTPSTSRSATRRRPASTSSATARCAGPASSPPSSTAHLTGVRAAAVRSPAGRRRPRPAASLRGPRADRRAGRPRRRRRVHRYAATRTTRPLKVTLPGPYTLSGRLRTGPGRGLRGRVTPPPRRSCRSSAPSSRASPPPARRSSRSTSRRRRSIPTPRPTSSALFNAAVEPVVGRVRLGAHLCFGNYLGRPLARADLPPGPRRDARLRRRRAGARVRQPRDGRDRDPRRDRRRRPRRRRRRHRRQELPPRDRPTRSPTGSMPSSATGVPAERLTLVPDCGFSQTARWATTRQAPCPRRRSRPRPRPVAPDATSQEDARDGRPRHHDARHRADRRLLHERPSTASAAATASGSSTRAAQERGDGVPASAGASPSRRPTWRRRSTTRTPTS